MHRTKFSIYWGRKKVKPLPSSAGGKERRMKRVVSIQDLSAVGKCSLTVALPIISAMGIECAVVPTAVLSTHTQFQGFTFRDLTDEMEPIADHWKQQGLTFDAVCTGYLGSFRQVDIVKRYFRDFGEGA